MQKEVLIPNFLMKKVPEILMKILKSLYNSVLCKKCVIILYTIDL